MHVSDVIAVRRELSRIGVADIAEHVKATRHKDGLGQASMAGCVHGCDVGLRIVHPLRNQAPDELQYAGRVHVASRNVLNDCARLKRHLRFRIQRQLQRQLRAALVAEFERKRACHVSTRGVAAKRDPVGIDAALGGMFAQPTHDELAFLDLNRPLILGRQLVIHAVDLGAAALCKAPHRGLELVQRADDEAAAVQINHRAAPRGARLGGVIDANQDGAVRTVEAKVFDLTDRRLYLVDEGVMLAALDMYGLVGTENRTGLQPFRDLRILRTTVHFLGNGSSVIDRHLSLTPATCNFESVSNQLSVKSAGQALVPGSFSSPSRPGRNRSDRGSRGTLYEGHAVAAVAATSKAIADQALSLIAVDYEVLPHVIDVDEAMSQMRRSCFPI